MPRKKIAVIGLGYVGLPLAIEFAKNGYDVVGFDTNEERVSLLQEGIDHTNEVDLTVFKQVLASERLTLSWVRLLLKECSVFIVTVPTPVDDLKLPNLKPLLAASELVGNVLKIGDIVIYESTVYPGCTEEDCVPVLEQCSGLKYNTDFFCGYSPERINPGDKKNTLTTIKKVTSGSTPDIALEIDALYKSIITAGTHLAPSIKVAEASKAIENAQRDLNISFVNELALIFDKMQIDTTDVLEAAATKWNFLNFKPGLVGGHCIGVDPYYLVSKAKSMGYKPEVILSGRRVNEDMGVFIANKVMSLITTAKKKIEGAKVLILGFTFKENCPDTRNTRVIDIYRELKHHAIDVEIYDPWPDKERVKTEFAVELLDKAGDGPYNAIILAVAHRQFQFLDFRKYKQDGAVIFDTKAVISRELVDARL